MTIDQNSLITLTVIFSVTLIGVVALMRNTDTKLRIDIGKNKSFVLEGKKPFIEVLEYQQQSSNFANPQTNEEIEQTIKSYRQQGRPRPSGLAKGEFVVPDDFNDPLPDEILDLFEAE